MLFFCRNDEMLVFETDGYIGLVQAGEGDLVRGRDTVDFNVVPGDVGSSSNRGSTEILMRLADLIGHELEALWSSDKHDRREVG